MVPFAIAISGGILFLLRVLIAFWVEEKRTHEPRVQIKTKHVAEVSPFNALARSSGMLNYEVRLKSAAAAVNEADEKTGSFRQSFKRSL